MEAQKQTYIYRSHGGQFLEKKDVLGKKDSHDQGGKNFCF